MKKHMALAAAAVALAGAAAVPAGSAFAKKPPGPVALAVHCGILLGIDNSYDAQITALGSPAPGTPAATTKAVLEALEASNDARIAALVAQGATCPDPT